MSGRIGLALLAGALAWNAAAADACAQIYTGGSSSPVGPTVSPYLNLLNSNNFGITNYQSLVRPLIDTQNALQRQGASINRLQQQVSAGPGVAPRASSVGRAGGRGTGHPTYFMYHSHFFSPGAR